MARRAPERTKPLELQDRELNIAVYLKYRSPTGDIPTHPPTETTMGCKNRKNQPPATPRKPDIRLSFERPAAVTAAPAKMAPVAQAEEEASEASQEEGDISTSPEPGEDYPETDSDPVTKGDIKNLLQDI
ncbi:Hypothetical predicted protein, partial [Pelobates cultripes]